MRDVAWRARALALMEARGVRKRRGGGREWRDARLGDGLRLAALHDPLTPDAPGWLAAFLVAAPADGARRRKLLDMAMDVNRARAPAWGYGVRLLDGLDWRDGEHMALVWRLDGRARVEERAFNRAWGLFVGRARALRRSWGNATREERAFVGGLRL